MNRKMTRHDMFVEMVSDLISTAEEQAVRGDRVELEEWLGPIVHSHLADSYKNENDDAVVAAYEAQLGSTPCGWEES
jgi:hypothetical protein